MDHILGPGKVEFTEIIAILRTMLIAILLTAAAQWIMNIANNRIVYTVTRSIREEAFQKIEILPLKYLDGHSTGEIVSRIIADVDQFADGLLMGFTQLFTGVATIVGTFIFHAVGQCRYYGSGCRTDTGIVVCGKLYCEADVFACSSCSRRRVVNRRRSSTR